MSSKNRSSKDQQHDERQHDDAWDVCPAGELTQMVHRLDASQRRARSRQVYKTALLSTAVFACVVLALGSVVGFGGSQYGGINCDFCRGHLAEYYPHAAGELVHQDAAFVTSMKTHLEKCQLCRGKFNTMYPDFSTASTARPTMKIAMQPMFAVRRLSIQ